MKTILILVLVLFALNIGTVQSIQAQSQTQSVPSLNKDNLVLCLSKIDRTNEEWSLRDTASKSIFWRWEQIDSFVANFYLNDATGRDSITVKGFTIYQQLPTRIVVANNYEAIYNLSIVSFDGKWYSFVYVKNNEREQSWKGVLPISEFDSNHKGNYAASIYSGCNCPVSVVEVR